MEFQEFFCLQKRQWYWFFFKTDKYG